jgi:hypothetical protein
MKSKGIAVLAVAVLCFAASAFAQSSGNFTYGSNSNTSRCVMNNNNTGTISGGEPCSLGAGPSCTIDTDCTALGAGAVCFNPTGAKSAGQCVSSTGGSCTSDLQCLTGQTCLNGVCGQVKNNACIGGFTAGIKTSGGNGNVFVIRPSAVIGLLTDASIGSKGTTVIGSSSALAGVDVSVKVSPVGSQPNPTLTPAYPVTYDSRFVQISSNLFSAIASLCTTTTFPNGCFFSFNQSTVSAHSFDWIASNLASGQYTVTVNWASALGDFGVANSMTCVGPVNLTVQQNKVFSFNTVNSF